MPLSHSRHAHARVPAAGSQHALARRVLVEPAADQRGWVRHGVLAVGVAVLGLGVAGSMTVDVNAENHRSAGPAASRTSSTAPSPSPSVSTRAEPGVALPSAFARRQGQASRSSVRPALAARSGTQRSEQLLAASRHTTVTGRQRAAAGRQKALAHAAGLTVKKAKKLEAARRAAERRAAERKEAAERRAARARAAAGGSGHASLPITSGFHIAAGFGDVGTWARYHTGIDFAAPIGTPIHAAAAGVVTNAGPGSATWAGHYVSIRHADGRSTLYAHMSTVSVHVGEHVSGGERVGAVGMTGRTFGPHCHFELYPAGVTPGDLYRAIDPGPWLHARGLHF